MPITFFCMSCGHKLNARDEHAGQTLKCSKCQTPITVPAATTAPPPGPPESTPGPNGEEKPMGEWELALWIGGGACLVALIGVVTYIPPVILKRLPVTATLAVIVAIIALLFAAYIRDKRTGENWFKWLAFSFLGSVFAGIATWLGFRVLHGIAAGSQNGLVPDRPRYGMRRLVAGTILAVIGIAFIDRDNYLFSNIAPLIDAVKSFIQGLF